MIAENPIIELLNAPLDSEWTIDGLAERLLDAVAIFHADQECVFVVDELTGKQSRRLIRPLLACLATMSTEETGNPVSLYGGQLRFKRSAPTGPVCVCGDFENQPGSVRLSLRNETVPAESGSPRLATVLNS